MNVPGAPLFSPVAVTSFGPLRRKEFRSSSTCKRIRFGLAKLSLKSSLLLQFSHNAIVHQVPGLELADLFIGESQEPDHVARVFDGGVDAATEGTYLAFISGFTPVAFCKGG